MEPSTGESRPHPSSRLARLLLCTAIALGCTSGAPPAPSRIDRVVRRLDASAFPGSPVPRHGPVAQIGDEARPVIRAPEEVLVAEKFGVVPADGKARVVVELEGDLASLPQNAFVLSAQELPFTQHLDEEVMAHVARENFSLRRDRGWRLERDEDTGTTVLELDQDPEKQVQINLRLTALRPSAPELESEPFDVPADAHLLLGFGLSTSHAAAETRGAEFTAELRCGDAEARELLRRRLAPDGVDAGWQDVDVPLPGPATGCRLRLANRSDDGESPRGAVWAVPQILQADDARADDANLVLISLDTLRSDHLSGLGYPRETSPTLDRELIAEGTAFTDVISTFPQTDVSHLSLFTGLYPSAQPKRGRVSSQDRLVLLAELLQQGGLETAAFTEDALVSGAFGFWYGFDQFTERSFAYADRGAPTIEDGVRYLEQHRDRRFFLFLHTYKTHDPYVPGPEYASLWSEPDAWRDGGPAPWVPEKHRDILDRYDRTIREADALVGRVLEALSRLGLSSRTYVVVTSDHGEAFGEHGIAGHGFTPHQEALRVPLLLRGPGVPAGRRVDAPVTIADLTPTILDLLGLPEAPQAQGLSLVAALHGTPPDVRRPLFFSWLRPEAVGVRRGPDKLTRTARGTERFDLDADPFEWKPDRGEAPRAGDEDLLSKHETDSARRRRELGPGDREPDDAAAPAIDERLEKSLEALGYL